MPGRISLKRGQSIGVASRRLPLRSTIAAATVRRPAKPAKIESSLIGGEPAVVLDDPALLLRVRLPVRLTNGNTGRTKTYHAAARFRKAIGEHLIAWGLKRTPFDFPVEVTIVRILAHRQRQWDSDAWQRGNLKEIIDALTATKQHKLPYACWFHDDSRKWITQTHFAENMTERPTKPAILIEVRKAEPKRTDSNQSS